ncbi:ABC transporter substrate-binding protein [Phytoactinopolyspora halotolerans]|uniref:ABC transporter substrate-binding protein n=1 Tax=Phytoactinopolyspora halotolerans TaxID=1981512 RepID=A0A6L9SK59_9ACTN|nr:ABC transporter substrate-binding protein [Phytoactinopolyspora halotolerans]NEE04721.1 ABC transporter substrate-binding protein [Phytoactinopolyspora halotolerans]
MRRIRSASASAGLAAGCAAALLLAACGGETETGSDGAGTLTVWFPGNSESEMALVNDTIVPAFEEETRADIEVTYVDWADISPKLNAAFAAGTAPDVIGHGVAATADLVHNDRIEDLTPYLDELDEAAREDMGAALPGGTVDGAQYMIPLIMTIRMIVYSGTDFAEAGLDPDQPPETWEDVRAVAEQLTQRDGGDITRAGLVVPSDPIGAQQAFGTFLWSNGGEFLNADNTASVMDSPEAVEALDYYVRLYQGPDAVDNTLGVAWAGSPEAQQPIATGDASMQLSNAGSIGKYQEAAPDRDLRLMMPPAFEGNEPQAFGGPANGLMINKDSGQKDLAWDFITHMIEADTNTDYAEALGALPIHASAVDSDYISANPELQKAVEALVSNHPNPNVPGWVQMRDAMGQHLERALHGEVDPQEALTAAAREVDQVIESGS